MNALVLFTSIGIDPQLCGQLCLMLAHSVWQVGLLALIATLITRFQKRENPEQGYVVYVTALLVGLAALPMTYSLVQIDSQVVEVTQLSAENLPVVMPIVQPQVQQTAQSTLPIAVERGEPGPSAQPAAISNESQAETFLLRFAPWLTGCYAVGVVVMLLRLGQGLWKSYKLARDAKPVGDGSLNQAFQKIARAWSLRVIPVLAQAQEIIVPQVVGLLRPTILLPTSALSGLSPEELEMILAHELAHVRRYDMWVNLLQRLAESVLFFNPALWYLSRRVSTYREYCCDEQTCRVKQDEAAIVRLRYAQALLHVVELSGKGTQSAEIAALAATGAGPSELRRRVARLFGEPLREPVCMSRTGLLTLIAGVAFLVTGPIAWQTAASDLATGSNEESTSFANIKGRIILEDGTPATTKGWMYYSSKQANANHVGTDAEYIDQFSCEVPPGTVWLRYFPDGFAPVAVGPFELKAGEKHDDVTIVLKSGSSQLIRIVGFKNQPIAEATVAAHPEFDGETGGSLNVYFTNDQGECLLTHLADTAYELVVNAPGHETLRSKVPRLSPDKPLVFTMTPSKPTSGIVRNADGSPAGGAKIYCAFERLESGAGLSSIGDGYGKLLATTDGPPTDSVGRFSLDQLTGGSRYLFVIEAADGTRSVVTNLQAGQQDLNIVLPKRHDMLVRLKGDLSQLPKHEGKPRLSVRQRIEFMPPQHQLIGEDVPIELAEENGAAMYYRGLAVDLSPDAKPQKVEVSLDYPKGPKKIVELKRDGLTLVEFELPNQEVEGTGDNAESSVAPAPKVEVVAIGTHDEEPQRWWNAEGNPLRSVPFTWEQEPGRVTTEEDSLWRRVVIRIDAPITNSPKDRVWNVVGARGFSGGTIKFTGPFEPGTYLTRYYSLPEGVDSFELQVGIATGAWKTLVRSQGTMGAHGRSGKSVVFSEPTSTNQGVDVIVSHNISDQAYQVVAVDKSGQVHESVRSGGTSTGNIVQTRGTFPNLSLEELDHFEFQVRNYEWTKIKDLPVEPGEKAADDQATRSRLLEELNQLTKEQDSGVVDVPRKDSGGRFAWLGAAGNDARFYHITSKKKFWRNMERRFDSIAEYEDALADVLEGMERDPYGPQVDLKELYNIALGDWFFLQGGKELLFGCELTNPQEAEGALEKIATAEPDTQLTHIGDIAIWKLLKSDGTVVSTCIWQNCLIQATNIALLEQLLGAADSDKKEMLIKVVDTDGQPISGAKVFHNYSFKNSDGKGVTAKDYFTNSEGEALLPLPGESVELRLWVSKPRYVPLNTMWSEQQQKDGHKIPEEFEFRMNRGTRISGIVTNVAGIPIPGVKVEVTENTHNASADDSELPRPIKRPGRSHWLAWGSAGVTTDAEGRWTVENIPSDEELNSVKFDSPEKAPLLLRFSHPEYEAIEGIEDYQTVWNPPLKQLRDGTSRMVMNWVDKDDLGRKNAIRLEQGETYEGADFHGRHFAGQQVLVWNERMLKGANLSDSVWEDMLIPGMDSSFQETDFTHARLKGIQLIGRASGAFQKAIFDGAFLESANLLGGVSAFQEARFDNASITNSSLGGDASAFQTASFKGAKFHSSKLTGSGPAFQKANFDDAKVVKTVIVCNSPTAFQGVRLNNAEFIEADLSSIDAQALASCEFDKATPPRYDAKTKFPEGFDPEEEGWKLISATE